MIAGIGVDVIAHEHMENALANGGEAFIRYTFTEAECAEAEIAADRTSYFAGRFCVKEAAIKAVGHLVKRIDMKDVETLCGPNGAPVAHAIGSLAKSMPPDLCFHVSISHETSLSLAFVVAHIP